eukprot:PLAT3662.28.p1 GENE.PLAT3662.28~~PLAT3662.28.p1  ORF type:complete len:604 (+),score=301.73 PLAT3662.28:50-1861(+)
MPIDINMLRADKGGDPDAVRASQAARGASVELVDEVIAIDDAWRTATTDLGTLQMQYNALNKQVGKLRKAGEDATELIAQVKAAKIAREEAKAACDRMAEERDAKLKLIGNIVHASVPVSMDEHDNVVERTWGEPRREPWLMNHHDVLHRIGGYDPERGVGVAGHRAYFLKGPGVLLNHALQAYGAAFLAAREYTLLQPPYMMKRDVMGRVAQLSEYDEALYHVTGDEGYEAYLIATSEQPICAMHAGERLMPKSLPRRYAGLSTCFRKEAGSHGRDTWGIFRVHQFEKVEQFMITTPETSWDALDEMIGTAEEFYKSLGLPYQVINIVSGELNDAAAKKFDLEAWFPGYNAYRELVSASNCTDYQSRSVGTRLERKLADRTMPFVHMLNATLCATERTLCCILENYQTKDGLRVPDVLVPFLGGTTFFPFVEEKKTNKNKKKMERAAKKKGGKKGGKKAAGGGGGGSAGTPAAAAPAAAPAEEAKEEEAPVAPEPEPEPEVPLVRPDPPSLQLDSDAGREKMNRLLLTASYLQGFVPTQEDAIIYDHLLAKHGAGGGISADDVNSTRWFKHVATFTEEERAAWRPTDPVAGAFRQSLLFKLE